MPNLARKPSPEEEGLLDDPTEVAAESDVVADDTDDLAFVGREFLTWLLWRVDSGEGTFGEGDEETRFVFGGRARLGALIGETNDVVLKGASPAHGIESRAAIGAGRTLREAELRVTRGEREWRFTLLADSLDLRGAQLPTLLTEEDDDRFLERIALVEELDGIVKMAFKIFLGLRTRPAWQGSSVPAMRKWIAEGLEVTG